MSLPLTEPSSLPPARRWPGRLAWALAGLAAVGVVGAALVAFYLPSNEALAQHTAQALTQALGVPVQVGGLRWQLLPQPVVVLTDVVARQADPEPDPGAEDAAKASPAISVQRITLVPELTWATLQSRRLRLLQAVVDGAVVQQRALAALGAAQKKDKSPDTAAADAVADVIFLDQLVWERVTWVSRHGVRVVLAGTATFEAAWRPRTVTLRLPDARVAADLSLTRLGSDDRWALQSRLGGGTASGELRLKTSATAWSLDGTLALQAIGVQDALQAVNRRSVVSGLAHGSTALSAHSSFADGPAQLVQSLRTDTRFTMGKSLMLRFDLNKAIRTAGSDTQGQTPLDSITGRVITQNTAKGMVIDFRHVSAASGVLSATGQGRLADRQVVADVSVDLVDGVVGVPLRLTGPVSAIKVSVAPGALAGAAVGTAVLPGVGTVLGARLGEALGKLFGNAPAGDKRTPRKP